MAKQTVLQYLERERMLMILCIKIQMLNITIIK